MKKFEMTEGLMTGIEDIDDDHRQILELGNRIASPDFLNSDKATIHGVLSFLESYVIYHFAAEEYTMFAHGFPGFEIHCRWHEQFQQVISDYAKQGRKESISKELLLRLSFSIEDWLFEHIRIMDRSFADFLRKKAGSSIRLPSIQILKDAGRLPKNFKEVKTTHQSAAANR
jgi:hemerythrin